MEVHIRVPEDFVRLRIMILFESTIRLKKGEVVVGAVTYYFML